MTGIRTEIVRIRAKLSRGLQDLLHGSTCYYAFSAVDLEVHHLLPVSSVVAVDNNGEYSDDVQYGKLGKSDSIRKNERHRFNSPCALTYAEKKTNIDIGTEKVSEYISTISMISKSHCIPSTSSLSEDLRTEEGQLKFLGERFEQLETEVKERLSNLGFF